MNYYQSNIGFEDTAPYGKVPSISTGRILPATRPEMPPMGPTVTIMPPTSLPPQPIGFTTHSYERFEMPQHVRQPYHFATEQKENHNPPSSNCPVCFTGIGHFQLPNDPTTNVFCNVCRQPYHFCPVHKSSLPGMGVNARDPSARQCQCQRSQAFLGDDQWNSCFNP